MAKIRFGFVSNSSSSSFILGFNDPVSAQTVCAWLKNNLKNHKDYVLDPADKNIRKLLSHFEPLKKEYYQEQLGNLRGLDTTKINIRDFENNALISMNREEFEQYRKRWYDYMRTRPYFSEKDVQEEMASEHNNFDKMLSISQRCLLEEIRELEAMVAAFDKYPNVYRLEVQGCGSQPANRLTQKDGGDDDNELYGMALGGFDNVVSGCEG